MASLNEQYADLLTLRFYSSLNNPPRVKPSELSNLNTLRRNKDIDNQCSGRCIQEKLTDFTMTICLTKDDDCTSAKVDTFYTEVESSECINESQWLEYGYDELLPDGSPYREFSLIPNFSNGCLVFRGESYIINESGSCDYCKLGGSKCSSTETKKSNQSHTVCKRALQTTEPNFPEISSMIQEFAFDNTNTSWLFREAMLVAIGSNLFKFTHSSDCSCSKEDVGTIPSAAIPKLRNITDSTVTRRETTRTNRARSTATRGSAPTDRSTGY